MPSYENYHEVRLQHNQDHVVLWKTLIKTVFSKYVETTDSVLELGAGFGEFINNIDCAKKTAIDLWQDMPKHLNKEITSIVGNIDNLDELLQSKQIDNGTFNAVFASNFFEHISQQSFAQCLETLHPKMADDARLIIMQPNYKYCYQQYFDDYTHISIWSDQGICDFLSSQGFTIEKCYPKFMPFSTKSRMPIIPVLIKLYLLSPWKPKAGQMLIIAKKTN